MNFDLQIKGMTCQNCVRHVHEALQSVKGVRSVDVQLEAKRARVVADDDRSPENADLVQAVQSAGYEAKVISKGTAHEHEWSDDSQKTAWPFNVVLGLVVTGILMICEWVLRLELQGWFAWVSFILALAVQIIVGKDFYIGAWRQLKKGSSNMDTLVALGSTAAFGLSTYGLFNPHQLHHLYFMEAVAIITLISFGHFLEARTSGKAASALRELMKLSPRTAWMITPSGSTEEVDISTLKKGDRIKVRPGEQIPCDALVVQGESAVNESMLTGESLPAEKTAGSNVNAGTLNENSELILQVTSVGSETALAQIIETVRRAQTSRADIQRIADQISNYFVPIVILIALGTLFGWAHFRANWERGIINAVGVLIVACPCAMGIATPAAIMAGTNVAAKRGILIRDGIALEKCGTITGIVFDKTGTLSLGKPEVASIKFLDPNNTDLPALTHAIASKSLHPYSRAIAEHFRDEKVIQIEGNEEHRGSGISARYKDQLVRLGSIKWLESQHIETQASLTLGQGTIIGLSMGEKLLAVFELQDPPKSHAREVLESLKKDGLKIYLFSGDMKRVVQSFAERLAIPAENVFGEMKPEEKASKINELQKKGERLAFVGDGINDSPALAQADLGIAVSRASDVARKAADIFLLNRDIESITDALGLSAATLRTIKQNLFWAFFYNVAAIPLAAFGLISPIVCAAAMGLSDLFVIGNALRLFRWKPKN